MMDTALFSATHVACEHGAPTWPVNDPESAAGPDLEPGLWVEVVETHDDWARIRCENGWYAWTDARWLNDISVCEDRPLQTTSGLLKLLGPIGGALCVLGAFLPWFSSGNASITGWHFWFWALLRDQASAAGPRASLLVLLSGLAMVPQVARVNRWALLGCSAPAGNVVALILFRYFSAPSAGRPSIGVGVYVMVIGTASIATGAWPIAFPNVRWRS